MEFDRRNQHGSTSEASREYTSTPGKTTLAEKLPPAGQHSAESTRSDDIGTRSHASPVPVSSGPRPSLQMLFRNRSAASPEQVHAAAARGTATAATQLPHIDQIQRSFGKHDVSGVQAHAGTDATASAQEMGATAYATENHVVLGASANLHTVAHEAAHVIQQRAGVQLAGGVGAAGDSYEQHADAVADKVVRGESAEALLNQHARGSMSGAAIQRQPAGSGGAQDGKHQGAEQRQPTGHVDRLIHLLATTQPRPDEQMDEAYAFLASLTVREMLIAIDGAAGQGALPQLLARSSAAAWFGRAQLLAAIYAVDLVHAPTKSPSDQRLHRASDALDQVSREMQLQILSWMLHRGSVSIEATSLVEGAIAMRADRDTAAASREQLPPGAGRGAADDPSTAGGAQMGGVVGASITSGAAPAPIMPGPWNPPGKQPPGLYVGLDAHDAIGDFYALAHPGDDLFLNHSPLSSILKAFEALSAHQVNAAALSEAELGRKPDITNISRRHLYEIKPLTAQADGASKASLYLSLFKRAGIEMTLGPMGEPGTFGGLPAPDGVFMFESPEPGVITYEYRKGRLVPVPVAEPEPATERRWRWELQPLTPMQKQAIVTTTVGGAMLLILMILLAPVGA